MYFCPEDDRRRDPGNPGHRQQDRQRRCAHPRLSARSRCTTVTPPSSRPPASGRRGRYPLVLPALKSSGPACSCPSPAPPSPPVMPRPPATTSLPSSGRSHFNTDVVGPDTSWALLNDGYLLRHPGHDGWRHWASSGNGHHAGAGRRRVVIVGEAAAGSTKRQPGKPAPGGTRAEPISGAGQNNCLGCAHLLSAVETLLPLSM